MKIYDNNDTRIDITDDFNRANKRALRKEKFNRFCDWCINHADLAIGGFCAGLGLVSTGIKVGGKVYKRHTEIKNRDLRCYDASRGTYWELRRRLTNKDRLEIDRRMSMGDRLGEILNDLGALK